MSFETVLLNVEPDGIAVLTLNRPEKRNALNAQMLRELDEAVKHCSAAENIRGVIVTGGGEKAFAAGADIGEIANATPVEMTRIADRGQQIFHSLETLGKASIAAVNGLALGGGLELAMACTFRVASEGAKMGLPEVKLGIVPGYGGTQRLPRLIGPARALEMLMTGEAINAAEAFRMGLVNHVVPETELLDYCRQMMRRILVNAPIAVRLVMDAVHCGFNFESAAFGVAGATRDWREGTQAFAEKRVPRFTGN